MVGTEVDFSLVINSGMSWSLLTSRVASPFSACLEFVAFLSMKFPVWIIWSVSWVLEYYGLDIVFLSVT